MSKVNKPSIPGYLSKTSQKRGAIGDRVIRFKCSLQNTILDVLRARGWQEVQGDHDWNLFWCDREWIRENWPQHWIHEHGKICHFPNHYEVRDRRNLYIQYCIHSFPLPFPTSPVPLLDLPNLREGDWDFYWCDVGWMKEYFDHYYMEEHMKISHFRNHYELTRKNLMVKNLKRYKKQLDREQGKADSAKCDFFPMTYELPTEYHMFVEEFKKNPGQIWIMKPVAKSQGKGIFLFRKLKDIVDWKKGEYNAQPDPNKEAPETYVVQRYIDDPYLIGGRKFDLRVYVLVTTYNPLKAWLYRGGFARFSNTRFSMDAIDDTYVHLTNVAVQKTAPDYDPEKGSKWSLQQLRKYLTAKHGLEQVKKCFRLMDDIFVHTLLSVQKIMINDKHCFELYGYDILLDSNLKPYLIEVNASPSLTASSSDDYDLKYGLLEDVLYVIDLENRLTGKEHRVGGFDLFWDDGPVYADEGGLDYGSSGTAPYNSYLGCANDRKNQLKQMFKAIYAAKKNVSSST